MVEPAPDITLVIAFAAGFLSFVSPCVLPLVPSYLIYITGLTLEELTSQTDRSRVRVTIVLNSLFFIVGLTAVFVAFGASASLIGQVLITYQDFIRKAGGVLIVIFGLTVRGRQKLNSPKPPLPNAPNTTIRPPPAFPSPASWNGAGSAGISECMTRSS